MIVVGPILPPLVFAIHPTNGKPAPNPASRAHASPQQHDGQGDRTQNVGIARQHNGGQDQVYARKETEYANEMNADLIAC
jgi:hypothetical protein